MLLPKRQNIQMMTHPERYNDKEVLNTYLETGGLTLYMHGPIGVRCFENFFLNVGVQTTLAFIKPFHWRGLTKQFVKKEHILVLRDPMEQHQHAAYLNAMSLNAINQKRDNMFYHTHLQPYLMTVYKAEFDFYIPFEKISTYLFDYQPPPAPAMASGQLFDIADEITAYEYIKENKMELTVPQWRDLIMRGQLDV